MHFCRSDPIPILVNPIRSDTDIEMQYMQAQHNTNYVHTWRRRTTTGGSSAETGSKEEKCVQKAKVSFLISFLRSLQHAPCREANFCKYRIRAEISDPIRLSDNKISADTDAEPIIGRSLLRYKGMFSFLAKLNCHIRGCLMFINFHLLN